MIDNPRDDATFFDRWTYRYVDPLLNTGKKKPLQEQDLYELPRNDKVTTVVDKLTRSWLCVSTNGTVNNQYWSLLLSIYHCYRFDIFFTSFLSFLEASGKIIQVVLLFFLISWLSGESEHLNLQNELFGWTIATLMGVLAVLQTLVHHVLFYITMRLGWNIKMALSGMIHAKVLKIGSEAMNEITKGKIVNLLSNDVQRFVDVAPMAHFAYVSIFEFISVLFLVAWQAGIYPALAGVGTTLFLVPIQLWLTKYISRFRSATASFTDDRVKSMADILHSIASVKVFAWEIPFHQRNQSLRNRECAEISKSQILKAINMAISFFAPITASFATFAVFWASGNELKSSSIFTTLGLLHILRLSVSSWSRAIEFSAETVVSIQRIQEFLLLPEVCRIKNDSSSTSLAKNEVFEEKSEKKSMVLILQSACFSWHKLVKCPGISVQAHSYDESVSELLIKAETGINLGMIYNINLHVKKGELIVICGPVGCGKSTLLEGILGEVRLISGNFDVAPTIRTAYVAQKPYVRACSFIDNIIFYSERNLGRISKRSNFNDVELQFTHYCQMENKETREKVNEAIDVCALNHDVSKFPNGIFSEIGERGINLSGGQKARLALARAVYSDADLVILDDPLSAVDPKVSHHIFENCILGTLLERGKTVLLATHQKFCLSSADQICMLNAEGCQVFCGTYNEFVQKGYDLDSNLDTATALDCTYAAQVQEQIHNDTMIDENSVSDKDGEESKLLYFDPAVTQKKGQTLTEKEDRVVGKVTATTYYEFAKHGGIIYSVIVFLMLVLAQALFVLSDWWLKYWISKTSAVQRENYMFFGFAALVFLTVLVGLVRSILFFRLSLRSCTRLHEEMFHKVIRSPMTFFHSNPTGRILNRFSNDQGSVDELLPVKAHFAAEILLIVIAAIVLVCITVPYVIFVIIPMFAFFLKARNTYLSSAREIKRLDAISRSPIFSEFGANLDGLSTLRSFSVQEKIQANFIELLENNGKAWYCFILVSRWLGFRLDLETAVFLVCTAFFAVGLKGSIDSDLMALALVYTLSLNGQFQWAVRQTAETESYLTAYERMLHYSKLSIEPTDGLDPPADWPSHGHIEINNLNVSYRADLPLVLQNISLTIKAGSKVGIAGRSGAGKSSLANALLRLNQIVSGEILVDGVDLLKLRLCEARKHISWIPQDPHMFSGTIRYNIDPITKYRDSEIWAALEKSNDVGLDTLVSDGGLSLSVGQRQLVSLARALLAKNSIIIMDESTANVDYETDKLIQTTMKTSEAFHHSTVITIAHRIHTIIDSDFIAVLSDGNLAEYGSPDMLLDNVDSLFFKMVRGTSDFESLKEMATER